MIAGPLLIGLALALLVWGLFGEQPTAPLDDLVDRPMRYWRMGVAPGAALVYDRSHGRWVAS